MAILFPALGIAFVAVCIWLSVRIFNRKERWAKWTLATVLGVPLLYVLSFVPGCWLVGRGKLSENAACIACRPLLRLGEKSELFRELMNRIRSQNDDVNLGFIWIFVSDFNNNGEW